VASSVRARSSAIPAAEPPQAPLAPATRTLPDMGYQLAGAEYSCWTALPEEWQTGCAILGLWHPAQQYSARTAEI